MVIETSTFLTISLFIVKMADGVKRARLDGDKEIYLAELLGVNIADAHTTVNDRSSS